MYEKRMYVYVPHHRERLVTPSDLFVAMVESLQPTRFPDVVYEPFPDGIVLRSFAETCMHIVAAIGDPNIVIRFYIYQDKAIHSCHLRSQTERVNP